jgi:hypothetical protein
MGSGISGPANKTETYSGEIGQITLDRSCKYLGLSNQYLAQSLTSEEVLGKYNLMPLL